MFYVIILLTCGQPELIIYHNQNEYQSIPYKHIIKNEKASKQLIANLNSAIVFEIPDTRGRCA